MNFFCNLLYGIAGLFGEEEYGNNRTIEALGTIASTLQNVLLVCSLPDNCVCILVIVLNDIYRLINVFFYQNLKVPNSRNPHQN